MSTIKTTTLSTQGGLTVPVDTVVNGTAKAWVNFNGTGTVAIRRAFNVSSITDNGTGFYTVNFTTAMPDANYAFAGGVGENSNTYIGQSGTFTTSAFQFYVRNNSNTPTDEEYVTVTIFS